MPEDEPGGIDHDGLAPTDGPGGPEPVTEQRHAGEIPDIGGDPVCWAPRVCPDCGLFVPGEPPIRCPRCGAMVGVD